ncbi:MAG TPA: UDP-3-O-(3-hydroxymyristoyl)glucosamine N-acyltransferase [Terriglobales bacterium]|nr:UDP-3-O-(3-hydroxymyristoyl)glucosamine N-acyltransferase [Terriglobales bacterium]
MKHSLVEVAKAAGARVLGDGTASITGVSTIQSATPEDLVFVEDEKLLDDALVSSAAAIVAGEFAAEVQASKTMLIAANPRLAFARAAAFIVPARRHEAGVHSTAVLHHSVQLGKGVAIQPHAVLTEGVSVGDKTRIGPGTAVGVNVSIGNNCNIAANVTIYPGVKIGDNVVVHAGVVLGADGFGYVRDPETGRYEKFPQLGTLIIEDDVEIGANATIDRGALGPTIIRRGTKIDNMVHIAHNVDVGEDVVIAAQTGISGSCVIEKNAVIAGQVGIADHVRIEEGVILGAQCGVPSKKVVRGKGELFWGTPARPIRGYLRELAVLARLAKKE